jgi:fatty-acid peroxygenase
MAEIPHDGCPESFLALIADPYGFIGRRCDRLGSDLFRTRLLLQTNICMRGPAAVELLCDQKRFTRSGAVLKRFERTLTGVGGVQGLDGEAHGARKRYFTSLLTEPEAARLAEMSIGHLRTASRRWPARQSIVLYDEAREAICRGVCEWAGVPVEESEYDSLTREIAAMYEHAASVSPKHFAARFARRKREQWIAQMVREVRENRLRPPAGSALDAIATHRDSNGELLDSQIAAVELLNVLRPVVAVAVYVTFAAIALHEHPECRESVVSGGDEYREMFAQEVRRYYPFFPAVAGRVRDDFEWHGYDFPKGMRVILGLHATNHDPAIWEAPSEFRPERFRNWNGDLYRLVPQGGGDRERDHRCPGDCVSVETIKAVAKFLCEEIRFEVASPDLRLQMSKLPPLPRDRLVIRNVRV